MSSTLAVPSRTQQIPASTIFAPRELKQYRRWQRLYSGLKPTQQGYVPTAFEYDQFQQWLKRQDSGYFSDVFDDIVEHISNTTSTSSNAGYMIPVAPICQHNIHPASASRGLSRCFVCLIDIHISYLRILQQVLHNAGGRAPSCTLTASEHQENAYNSWMLGKMGALHELAKLEVFADEEEAWSSQHPGVTLENVQTAKKALHLYWSETQGLFPSRPRSPKSKTVVFSQDTSDEPGRPSMYFWQKSPRYEPGRYTIQEEPEDDEDIVSEDSEDYFQAFSTYPQINSIFEESTFRPAQHDPVFFESRENEPQEDDGDSDWEDIDVDHDSSSFMMGYSEYGYSSDNMDESASFVIFADD
ncbi:hypothetical protein ACN47E_006430 [Coniothyrium glycines]